MNQQHLPRTRRRTNYRKVQHKVDTDKRTYLLNIIANHDEQHPRSIWAWAELKRMEEPS